MGFRVQGFGLKVVFFFFFWGGGGGGKGGRRRLPCIPCISGRIEFKNGGRRTQKSCYPGHRHVSTRWRLNRFVSLHFCGSMLLLTGHCVLASFLRLPYRGEPTHCYFRSPCFVLQHCSTPNGRNHVYPIYVHWPLRPGDCGTYLPILRTN